MNKLDLIFAYDSFLDMFVGVTKVVLDKFIPVHRQILLKEKVLDFGPTPFCFFNSWLDMEDFHKLVTDTWTTNDINDVNSFVAFKKKLQNLKKVIRK